MTHDIGYLKRIDRDDGKSDLVDGFGKVVAVINTPLLEPYSQNLDVRRFRVAKSA